MADEGEPQKIEISDVFYIVDDYGVPREAVCVQCNKRACVRAEDVYFCNRCWEFLPRE